jgi:hypothetical protein
MSLWITDEIKDITLYILVVWLFLFTSASGLGQP